jgi:hypothetical protein
LKVVPGTSIAFAGDHGSPSRIRCEGALGRNVHRRTLPADGSAVIYAVMVDSVNRKKRPARSK